ncbi:MAG: T9SS type A sorting domain-containing protein, partial [Flavobacteriaceae bacterium]|nr:T9SS type A sorting domain-containing protein [Flavobacteriaceae bacterium]
NELNGTVSGRVRIFDFDGNQWAQVGEDLLGEAQGDFFGRKIALNGDGTMLLAGSYANDANGTNSGSARIFKEANGGWQQIGEDIDGEAEDDFFGEQLDISEDGFIIGIAGASNDNNSFENSGHVKMYEVDATLDITESVLSNNIVYPNPANKYVNFANLDHVEKISIYSIHGQELKSIDVENSTKHIDISDLSVGTYFIRLISGDSIRTLKLIKY